MNDTMFTKVFWAFLILETCAMGVFGLYCPNYHIQTQYCVSKYVFIAKVIHPVNETGPHKMRLITLFKGNKSSLHISKGNVINVETDYNVKLVSEVFGDKYVVFGDNRNGIVHADSCIKLVAVEHLTPYMDMALRYYYFLGCSCIHEILNDYHNMHCEYKYSTLMRMNGKCSWTKGDSFEKCKALLANG